MTEYSDLAQIPIPDPAEGPTIPAHLAEMVDVIDKHLNLFAISSTQRDELYSDAEPGVLVSCTTQPIMWLKTIFGWRTLYSDTGDVAIGDSGWPAAFDDAGTYYRIVAGWVMLTIAATYTGTALTSASDGTIADGTILTVPDALKPQRRVQGIMLGSASGVCTLLSDGRVRYNAFFPGNVMATNTTLFLNFAYPAQGLDT